ncbi:MAG: bifunctional folylpolyglutamate synthase/dihydrofolate synthase [Thermoplasmata archaeon]|nr:MAG: bifunctional folylpolyglutamate synthase/dihydrofolate synthase [Thermoplasmata archaeon]
MIEWLQQFKPYGIKLGLDRIRYIVDKLGNPEGRYRNIHVAGTNGKGTVCRLLSNILLEDGYHVGLYTSPHLYDIRERFIVDNKIIEEEKLLEVISIVKPVVDKLIQKKIYPTYFEVTTAIAFQYFSMEDVDIAVIEVGMGGRSDATNIITPMVSIITNISLDHQQFLGETIEEIAFEKAGVIKNDIPVITAADKKALKIIEKIAIEKNSPLRYIKKDYIRRITKNIDRQIFHIELERNYTIETSLLGSQQGENIAITLAAIEELRKQGLKISDESIKNGVRKTSNPGRMELISRKPLILLDGAHNIAGIKVLKENLLDFNYDKLILVFGVLKDKNYSDMIDIISENADIIILTQPDTSRASPVDSLIKLVDETKKVYVTTKVRDAVDQALKVVGKKDMICITGSLYTVGEAREILMRGRR